MVPGVGTDIATDAEGVAEGSKGAGKKESGGGTEVATV